MKPKIQINRSKCLVGDFVLELDEAAIATAKAINESSTTQEAVIRYRTLVPTVNEKIAMERITTFLEIVQQLERGVVPTENEVFADSTKGTP